MAKFYILKDFSKEFLQDVVIESVEGHQLVTIKNTKNQYLTAHSNKKHVYWSDNLYGMWEFFSYDMDTERIVTIHETYVWFDGYNMWQYSSYKDSLEGSVIVMGEICNLDEDYE